jgi:hypothetical protein
MAPQQQTHLLPAWIWVLIFREERGKAEEGRREERKRGEREEA